MVSHSTLLALNRRALRTAGCLEYWAEHLHEEIKKQNIELYPKQEFEPPHYIKTDDSMTMTLTRGDVRRLILQMSERAIELRKFTRSE